MVKKTISALACALIAPLAFAQTSATTAEQMTTGSGTVTTYEPGKIIVVGSESAQDTFSYVLDNSVRYVNKAGIQIDEHLIKPGARVHVYYGGTGETPVVNRVVVEGKIKRKMIHRLKSAGS
jgi:formylmethanofuran dehydrogenase subunit C